MLNRPGINLALIDDGLPLRKLLSGYLGRNGFNIVLEASNGHELLAALEVADQLPDVCLIDAHMPVMDGFEAAGHVKDKFPSILIAGYSFIEDTEIVKKFLTAGADDFISKEAKPAELKDALIALYTRTKENQVSQ